MYSSLNFACSVRQPNLRSGVVWRCYAAACLPLGLGWAGRKSAGSGKLGPALSSSGRCWVNEFCPLSPVLLGQPVDEFEKAHRALQAGDVGPMTGFTNETLGETWELKGDSSDEHALPARADDYPLGRVPASALLLTAGVDVQRDR